LTCARLCQQPAWGRSREFEITTRSVNRSGLTQSTTGDLEEEDEAEEGGEVVLHGRKKRKVAFMPSLGTFKSDRRPRAIFILILH
jgi:chaperone BCS1